GSGEGGQDCWPLLALCDNDLRSRAPIDAADCAPGAEQRRGLCGHGLSAPPQRYHWRARRHRCGEPTAGKDAQPKQFQKSLFGKNAVMPGGAPPIHSTGRYVGLMLATTSSNTLRASKLPPKG